MRRLSAVLLVLLLVLGIGAVIADRVAAAYAERRIADQLSTELTANHVTSAPPKVDVVGVPFLTQAFAGDYHEINVELRDLRGGTVPLPRLSVAARDVTAPLSEIIDGTAKPVAAEVTGVATVTYQSLADSTGLPGLRMSGDGEQVTVAGKVALVGEVTGTAKVTTVDGSVRLAVTDLRSASGSVNATLRQLLQRYADQMVITLRLPELPFGMKIEKVTADPAGLLVTATAQNVPLT